MGDIEDGFDVSPSDKSSNFRIKVRSKKEANKRHEEPPNLSSILSWSKTVYLRTWGCSHNSSDSEHIAGLLAASGFTVTSKKDAADC